MISPESLEEERDVGKPVMEGDSSEGDSPEQKRMRLDDPEEEDKKMLFHYFHTFPEPIPDPDELPDPAIQEEEDGFPDPAFCEEEEFPDPAFCAIQEEEAQQMTVDAAGVGDYESVDQITEDDEWDEEKVLARVHNLWRARMERPLTEEEKKRTQEFNTMFINLYGSVDFTEEMDSRIELRRAEQDRDRLHAEELNKHKVDKVEQILDYKEIQRVDKILQEVVDRTLPVPTVPLPDEIVTDVEFFLLDPWEEDEGFMHRDAGKSSLDLYYKRLFPNLPSARTLFYHYMWNRLPEVDAEYLCLYSELCCLVKPDEKSYTLFVKSNLKNRLELYAKAVEIAKQREITKLTNDDIAECLQDVFKEGDTIAEHKLKAEFDMFLLDCEYDSKLHRTNFSPKEYTPVFENVVCFQRELQQSIFDTWMEKRRSLNLGKAEHQEALNLLHAKNIREDCGIRIRFIKFKRAWAKERGLISEETRR